MFKNPYDFYLPENLIAQSPATRRDQSKLLVINKHTGELSHHRFFELPRLLTPSDVLVFNQTKVIPARLYGQKTTGGKVEILLLKQNSNNLWEIISHPGLKPQQVITFAPDIQAAVIDSRHIKFNHLTLVQLSKLGHTPLPPYIHSPTPETILRRQYQTVYAKYPGSAAAPTAGLHFTQRLINKLKLKHIELEFLTLHVGLGTFKPPTTQQIVSGVLHSEDYILDSKTASNLNKAKQTGSRIIAVGTTVTRVLETCSNKEGMLIPNSGSTDIFIHPPYKFKFVDGLITNFHLPKSSLLMLVSAFSSPEIVQKAYTAAIRSNYRFFSFGDACFFI